MSTNPPAQPELTEPAETPDPAAVTVIVLNSSMTQPEIDIQVWIDGQLMADDTFVNGVNELGITIHRSYTAQLAAGTHELRVQSKQGNDEQTELFTTTSGQDLFILVGYEYDPGPPPPTPPGQFRILFQDQPFRFG